MNRWPPRVFVGIFFLCHEIGNLWPLIAPHTDNHKVIASKLRKIRGKEEIRYERIIIFMEK
jgi:hypothetical protein